MSQNSLGNLPPDSTSGTQLATKLVDWQNALHSCHSSNGVRPSYATAGMQWIDTTTRFLEGISFDGTNDIQEGWIDTINNKAYPGTAYYNGAIRELSYTQAVCLNSLGGFLSQLGTGTTRL